VQCNSARYGIFPLFGCSGGNVLSTVVVIVGDSGVGCVMVIIVVLVLAAVAATVTVIH